MKIISIFILLSSISFLTRGQVPERIPAFSNFINLQDESVFTVDSLRSTNMQMFILYDPGCGHCQELAAGIVDSLHRLPTDLDLYFISLQKKESVDGFVNMFAKALKNHPQVTFLYDPQGEFILKFDPKNFPSTYIYAAGNFKLIKYFDGERKVAKILPFIDNRAAVK